MSVEHDPMNADLDLVTIGRVSVDLYGQQIGSRLEDVASFSKGVGGCPTNIAIGAARLGLKSAVITVVGAEPMGRYVVEQLGREGVDTTSIRVDKERLTSLVLLSVRDETRFPLIFYRENCADSSLCEQDVDEALVARARAIVVTGTHFSIAAGAAAQRKAIGIARRHGRKVILDIDYRPNLWGAGGHDAGESRYARSSVATNALAAVLPDCDLIVGTEEELHIAAGVEDTLAALHRIRAVSKATIVCKRGAEGCIVFAGPIPERLEQGLVVQGMPVKIYNVLGAGDAFMAGFLRGYLTGEPLETSARFGNACGAIAVSRLLCSSEYPTFTELSHYLNNGSAHRALREDPLLNHLHRIGTRARGPQTLRAFAIDHRRQFEELSQRFTASLDKVAAFKVLALQATEKVAQGRDGFGILLDSKYGGAALAAAGEKGLWIARPVELPGSRPLDFEGNPSLASQVATWPIADAVKCLCFYHPDDPAELRQAQERELLRVAAVCADQHRDLLLEIIASKHGVIEDDTAARVLARLYELGIRPVWWKLEAQASRAAWKRCAEVITSADPYCRGMLVLGLDAPMEELGGALRMAADEPMVRGFAVGRTIFMSAAEAWFAGSMSDSDAVKQMSDRFGTLVDLWDETRSAPVQRSLQ